MELEKIKVSPDQIWSTVSDGLVKILGWSSDGHRLVIELVKRPDIRATIDPRHLTTSVSPLFGHRPQEPIVP